MEDEEDLFEQAKETVKKEKERAEQEKQKLKEKLPDSKDLYDETVTTNKFLAKDSKKIEVIEMETDSEDDEDVTNAKLFAQLRTRGLVGPNFKIMETKVKTVASKDIEDSKIDLLEDEDISKYIGSEETENDDKLFG